GGGIAAYKAGELVRELRRAGADVRVAMTEAAQQFVTPLTFMSLSGNPVLTNYFDAAQEGLFGHLHLARWADLYVVAPATADLIGDGQRRGHHVLARLPRPGIARALDERGDVRKPDHPGESRSSPGRLPVPNGRPRGGLARRRRRGRWAIGGDRRDCAGAGE